MAAETNNMVTLQNGKLTFTVPLEHYKPGTVCRVSQDDLKKKPFKKTGQLGSYQFLEFENANDPDFLDVEVPANASLKQSSGTFRIRCKSGAVHAVQYNHAMSMHPVGTLHVDGHTFTIS
jgi:hypothetical protein